MIEAISATTQSAAVQMVPMVAPTAAVAATPQSNQIGFADLLGEGLGNVEAKLERAGALVRQFAVDDRVPVHQVTIALEEARLAVELAMQVRSRLVDGYRDLMNMQL
jgi:flagellar hook-basal body complex protein FliE